MKRIFLCLLCVLWFAVDSDSYELILKNGKVIKGKLISEDDQKIVVEDNSGVRINFKKINVDLEKTAAANVVVETPSAQTQPIPAKEEKKPVKTVDSEKPKKPARVYSETDVYRLRSKYPMAKGKSVSSGGSSELPAPPEEKSEDYWKNTARELHAAWKQAEAAFNSSTASCQKLKGATIQTHVVLNEKREVQDMAATTKEICQQAEDLKGVYDQAKADYDAFMQDARMENVPPGWLQVE